MDARKYRVLRLILNLISILPIAAQVKLTFIVVDATVELQQDPSVGGGIAAIFFIWIICFVYAVALNIVSIYFGKKDFFAWILMFANLMILAVWVYMFSTDFKGGVRIYKIYQHMITPFGIFD